MKSLSLTGQEGAHGAVQAAGVPWVMAGSQPHSLQNWMWQNLSASGCVTDYLITDIHGGVGALWMGMPCANANVTARGTTQGPQ